MGGAGELGTWDSSSRVQPGRGEHAGRGARGLQRPCISPHEWGTRCSQQHPSGDKPVSVKDRADTHHMVILTEGRDTAPEETQPCLRKPCVGCNRSRNMTPLTSEWARQTPQRQDAEGWPPRTGEVTERGV